MEVLKDFLPLILREDVVVGVVDFAKNAEKVLKLAQVESAV